jgi:plasmid stabilization system protein ParE
MGLNVVLSPTAKQKLEELLIYLKNEWSEKIRQEFIEKLDSKIIQVSNYPTSCPTSDTFKNLYKCVVTKQTTFYYRIKTNEIEIATFFDTRQNPQALNS